MMPTIAALLVLTVISVWHVGHIRRQCPLPRQYRSYGYVIKLLELARNRTEQRTKQGKDPLVGSSRLREDSAFHCRISKVGINPIQRGPTLRLK